MCHILIVSLDWLFRALIGAELIERGYDVEGADTLEEARGMLTKAGKVPELMLIEARGQSFNESSLAILSELSQKSTILVCAGPNDMIPEDLARFGVQHIVTKPLTVGDIVAEVVKLVGASHTPLDLK